MMTEGSIHQISSEIGGLKSDVRNLQTSIENLNRIWGEREHNATEGRRVLHDKFDEMRTDLNHVEAQVNKFSRDFDEIKPVIDDLKTERAEQVGARRLGWKLWAALSAAAGAFGWIAHEWLNFPRPH
jgi:SMC interacting uncharacterized protein involved in chromosome segregation